MDRGKLTEILSMDDSMVTMQELVIVERMIAKYPYCAVFRVLALRFASVIKAFNRQELLSLAGVYVSDREYLKRITESIHIMQKRIISKPKDVKKEDIITEINSYKDERLSDNPTRQELLDKFLKIENPKKISAQTVTDEENIDTAIKQSAVNDFKIVTETLAKIYAEQGDMVSAVKIYKQLILQHPDKEIHYKKQIELLKNK